MPKNTSKKSTVIIQYKGRGDKLWKHFVPQGSIHYEDTPQGIEQATNAINSIVPGNLSHMGKQFKLSRQNIVTNSSTIGNTSTTSTSYENPIEIPNTTVEANKLSEPIINEALAHNKFVDDVLAFVKKRTPDHTRAKPRNWERLGFSSPMDMVNSRQPGETPEQFIKRHGQKIKEKIGAKLGNDIKYGRVKPTPKPAPKPKIAVSPERMKRLSPKVQKHIEEVNTKKSRPKATPKPKGKPGRPPGTKSQRTKAKALKESGFTAKGPTAAQQEISKKRSRARKSGTVKPQTLF